MSCPRGMTRRKKTLKHSPGEWACRFPKPRRPQRKVMAAWKNLRAEFLNLAKEQQAPDTAKCVGASCFSGSKRNYLRVLSSVKTRGQYEQGKDPRHLRRFVRRAPQLDHR